MEFKDQVVSQELAKKMKELGFEQDGYFTYFIHEDTKEVELTEDNKLMSKDKREFEESEWYPAYTVAELGEMLPDSIMKNGDVYRLQMRRGFVNINLSYEKYGNELAYCKADTEADARAKLLIYLKENKLI